MSDTTRHYHHSVKSISKKRIFPYGGIALTCVLLVLFGIGFFITTKSPGMQSRQTETAIITTPTPFPFQEMTIPHLRNRSYASSLGTRERMSENGVYTSYKTSFDSDGLTVYGQLTVPTGDMPLGGWPAIIFVHGYIPPSIYQTFVNYASYVDYLARRGFVIFKIDLRGHGNSEGDAGGAYYSSDYIIDTLNARAALESSDLVNPKRIGLWGHSMAGNIVSRTLAVRSDIPATVIWAGAVYTYSDFSEYRISDSSYQPRPTISRQKSKRDILFETYGQFKPDSAFWKQVPMTNYLAGINGAIQIHHATDDAVVNIGYSRNFVSILDKTPIVHEYYEYPSGGHNFTGSAFVEAMDRTIEFFQEHL